MISRKFTFSLLRKFTFSLSMSQDKRLPGGKIMKEEKQELGKKFATGASVVKGPTEFKETFSNTKWSSSQILGLMSRRLLFYLLRMEKRFQLRRCGMWEQAT
ncbi:translation machinery-associated protein 22 [Striga asiatica]|uniref:Translation machinery-associated protein 22 n=1 Tax=Striga asiatica TaxID=4170 RepID=A0A5A7PS04_STRAF|nr:translation machinery-associated protein 22 [Striga asiatica]